MMRTRSMYEAIFAAHDVRATAGVGAEEPFEVFDEAERQGLDVWIWPIGTLEGIYLRRKRRSAVLVPAQRPTGRQVYACTHEWGHHVMGHGTTIDEMLGSWARRGASSGVYPEEERMADLFAGELLMSQAAIARGFQSRGWDPTDPRPLEVYTVAWWLGVAYEALVTHMRVTELLGWNRARKLENVDLATIRSQLLGRPHQGTVVPVDTHWLGRAIDVQAGDHLLLPNGCLIEGLSVRPVLEDHRGLLVRAVLPGISRISQDMTDWAAMVRVQRTGYAGLAPYRHLEEVEG